MTTATKARQIVTAFLAARAQGNMEVAATYLAPTFSFETPLMHLDDPTLYLASHGAAQSAVLGQNMISELYGDGEATLLYDLRLHRPAGAQRTAEHLRLVGDKIATIVLISTPLPGAEARPRSPGGPSGCS